MKPTFTTGLILSLCLLYGTSAAHAEGASGRRPKAATPAHPASPPLSGVKTRTFDRHLAAQLDAYIARLLKQGQVPGAAVAVVQNGKVVYTRGFGVREKGKQGRVSSKTLMMIGSLGKSMTTLMMATLVDAGKMRWDTPVVQIYPTFAVSDPQLTPKVTMFHLVGNNTGIKRHDMEIFFADTPATPESVIRSVRHFPFIGTFGKTFGYINQMVSAGGYIAARAAGEGSGDLYTDYLAQMQKRVFDPIGMTNTTFSLERVLSSPDYATPHGLTAAHEYVPIAARDEARLVGPFAPAGASWSNVEDMARYLLLQMNRGVAANGRRVVSVENLKTTWQPQIEIRPGLHYGLGWLVGQYKGQPILTHGGETLGFSSDMTFLPEANLGVVILTNAYSAQLFCEGVRSGVLELAFGEPLHKEAMIAARMRQARKRAQVRVAPVHPLDSTAATPYLGVYANPDLGTVRVIREGDRLILSAGGFRNELRQLGKGTYVIWNPPLAGAQIRFTGARTKQAAFVFTPFASGAEEVLPDSYRFSQTLSR